MTQVPDVTFKYRRGKDWVDIDSQTLFANKRVVVFALPGAFTPTCSAYQLPGYEAFYDMFREQGIDEVFCLSVNDAFVMNAWGKDQGIEKVKLIPDGNGEFTSYMGLLVKKFNLGFASRSWRYAMVVNDMVIEQIFAEDGIGDNVEEDPYEWSTPEKLLEYVKGEEPVIAQ